MKVTLQRGSMGTIVVGLLFICIGFAYLDDISANAVPTNWQKVILKELKEFDDNIETLKLNKEEVFKKEGYPEDLRSVVREVFLYKAKAGREQVFGLVKNWRNLNEKFILVRHPINLFIYFFVTMWMFMFALGMLILFPWSKWFILITITVNYIWISYVFLYEEKLKHLVLKSGNDINQLLDLPLKIALPAWQNQEIIMQSVHSILFVILISYFTSKSTRDLFVSDGSKSSSSYWDMLKDFKKKYNIET